MSLSRIVSVTITPNSSAYSAGDALVGNGGSGPIALSGPNIAGSCLGAILESIDIVDSSGQDAPIDFLLFTAAPTGTITDQSAYTPAAADEPNMLGPFSVSSYKSYNGVGKANLSGIASILAFTPPAPGTIWLVPVVQGAPTYGSGASLTFRFGLLVDTPADAT